MPPLFEAGTAAARRLPLGNLLVRAAGSVVVLPFLPQLVGLLAQIEPTPVRLVVNFHTVFNLALAMLFLPEELSCRVGLVVVLAVGEHRQLMEVFGEPHRRPPTRRLG